jgi:hypothetical protein
VANRLLGNGCSYMPNFGHSEVLIRMIDEMPLLLAPRDKFLTLNVFDRKFSVDFPPTRDDWSAECVDLVALVNSFSLLLDLFGHSECQRIICLRLSCYSVNPKYMLFWRVRSVAFRRALSTEQYESV